jgi:hypothetical protein
MSDRETGLAAPPGINSVPAADNHPHGLEGLAFWNAFCGLSESNGRSGMANPSADFRKDELLASILCEARKHLDTARQNTQMLVKEQLLQMNTAMKVLDRELDQIVAKLDEVEAAAPTESIDARKVNELLAKIEKQWGFEIQTLKQELHQTILAHNHNADLVKHHKDSIAEMGERLDAPRKMTAKLPDLQRKFKGFEASLKKLQEEQKPRKMDTISKRLQDLEAKIRLYVLPYAAYPDMPSMGMPGLAGMTAGMPPGIPSIPPGMLPGAEFG